MTWELYVATIIGTTIVCYILMDYRIDDRDVQIYWLNQEKTQLQMQLGLVCPACGGPKRSSAGTLCTKCERPTQSFDEAMAVLQDNGLLHESQN